MFILFYLIYLESSLLEVIQLIFNIMLLSTHSHDPCKWGESDLPICSPPTSFSTVCVAIDLTAAFDTMSHEILISKIARSSLPPAITRWQSCYLRGRQAATSFRGIIVCTGVPQGSKLSPSLFNYYIADMPRPTPLVKSFF